MSPWPASALVLAAGIGTRLRPLTDARAKPAVPVAGAPLIARILRRLAHAGVCDVVVNLHYRPETIAAAIGEGRDLGVAVRYSWEHPVLGSAGGPRRAQPLLGSDPYLLINGDTWPTVDLRALWDHHHAHGALVTMTLVPNPAPQRFGGVLIDADGWVTGFCRRGDPRPSYHFMFAQVIAHEVFAHLPDGKPAESVLEVYPAMLATRPRTIRGYVCEAPFVEIGTPADYLIANAAIAADEGADPYAPGRRCAIAASARVTRSILWDDVVVGDGAIIDECILADGVQAPAGARWSRLAVVRAPDRPPQGQERVERGQLLAPI